MSCLCPASLLRFNSRFGYFLYPLFLLLFLIFSHPSFAQQTGSSAPGGDRIYIDKADELSSGTSDGKPVKRLKGGVQFHQLDVIMTCDSAYLFSDQNLMNAFGHVHIKQGDSLNLYGDVLDYDGNKHFAILKKNVSLLSGNMRLITDRLDYDLNKKQAYYTNRGTLTDADNILTSQKGYFFTDTRDMYFRNNVVLVNPEYKMFSDTLQYNLRNRRAIFHGPTTITSKKDTIYCETGWYSTTNGEAHFGKNAHLISGGQTLFGDSIIYDRKKSIGRAIGGVKIVDTAEKLIITGDISGHFEKIKRTFITGHVLARKELDKDTMFMTADTLWSEYDPTGKYRIMRGFKHAKIFSREFQARCDSIRYSFVDSTIDMKMDPVFWFDTYQATADHIVVYTKKNRVYRANMYKNSFLLTREDSLRYSQVKGRNMVGSFKDNELYLVDVNGNGESIYYVKDEKKAYIGANRIVSSNIRINVKERKINRINFIKDPDAKLTPILKADPKELILQGFKWREGERPASVEDLMKNPPAVKNTSLQ